jgi:isopropylmalate/homocitrate/citramalate synthase
MRIRIREALEHLLWKISFALFSPASPLGVSAQPERSGYTALSEKKRVIRDYGRAKSRDCEGLSDVLGLGGALPHEVESLFRYLSEGTLDLRQKYTFIFSSHNHNDNGLALANS